jgi:hypothetical protein
VLLIFLFPLYFIGHAAVMFSLTREAIGLHAPQKKKKKKLN